MAETLYIEIDLLSAILLVIIGSRLSSKVKARDRRAFSVVCFAEAISLLIDSYWTFIDGTDRAPIWVNYTVNILYFISTILIIYLWLCFEKAYLNRGTFTAKQRAILLSPVALAFILNLTTPLTHWIFYIDPNNVYTRGNLYVIQAVLTFGYIIGTVVYAAVVIIRGHGASKKYTARAIMVGGFGIVFLAGSVLDTVFPDMNLSSALCAVAFLVLLLSLWDSLSSSERDMLMAAVEDAYPLSVYVNVTVGRFRLIDYKLSKANALPREGFVEDLCEKCSTLVPEEDREEFLNFFSQESMLKLYREGQKNVLRRHRVYYPDGSLRWIACRVVFMDGRDDDEIRQVILMRNIDEEMARELKLKEAQTRAEAANVAKSTFLFNMSHDIRTPMNAIMGFTDMARKYKDDPKVIDECLGKVSKASNHLLGLINEVLDMSRIESGNMKLEETVGSLLECGEEVMDIIRYAAEQREVNVESSFEGIRDRYVVADLLRINQILLNIASNAVKYTNSGGNVKITISQLECKKQGYGLYECVVKDTGVGMSPEFMEHIYDAFSRERSSTCSGVEGTGLGMAITKQLVSMMNGTIQVASKPGEGTEVTIRLELKLASPEAIDSSEKKEGSGRIDILKGKKALIVEDNELNLEIASELLKGLGMETDSACNGREAVDKVIASAGDYSVVLMDIQMPVMDGFEATKTIRQLDDSDAASLPIIAMTANAFTEDKQKAYDAGMNAHLGKPINMDELVKTLKRFV